MFIDLCILNMQTERQGLNVKNRVRSSLNTNYKNKRECTIVKVVDACV